MKKIIFCLVSVVAMSIPFSGFSQLTELSLDEKIAKAMVIAEGTVISQQSFWNQQHTMIFTSNVIRVSLLMKGNLPAAEIQVITQGGSVDNFAITTDHLLEMYQGETGVFFLVPWNFPLQLPGRLPAYDVYASQQGLYLYAGSSAVSPFESRTIANLQDYIKAKTGRPFINIDPAAKENPAVQARLFGTIASFSPQTVTGGTLNDPPNNILTINGNGFGQTPAAGAAVLFKNADNSVPQPLYPVPFNSPYIISWTDQQIKIRVPDKAGTGPFAVVRVPGDTTYSPTNLDVFYSVQNAIFNINGAIVLREPRLMYTNSHGGYSVFYSTGTSGGGRDISTAPEKQTFQRALTTWKEAVGFNAFEEGNTTVQQVNVNDQMNVVMFDNNNTGQPPLPSGTLAVTYSGFSMCSNVTFEAQKVGFDIVIRNNGVSQGNTSFTTGPCFPPTTEVDLETVILHELGHAVNLGHIVDNFQTSNNTFQTVNPAKLMNFAVLAYVTRRSLDQSAYQGGLYCVTPLKLNYGSCSLSSVEMVPLPRINPPNDECPLTFAPTATAQGSSLVIDLVHTTSNKSKDPQYTAVTCTNAGTQVTNNAYEVIKTATNSGGSLDITISNYQTFPADQQSCAEEGVRLAVYAVNSCPSGQNYPAPIVCRTFTGNGPVTTITGLQSNTTYLLYFDGLRNTKAAFLAKLSGSALTASNTQPQPAIIYPNPASSQVNVQLKEFTNGAYNLALFDERGRLVYSSVYNVTVLSSNLKVPLRGLASGVYHLRLTDPAGTIVIKNKIVKISR
ncbi:MAG: type sorting protein [Chitinophagaceae bacterium]|nr:type sorting protein [Chitinophagaceae bacterium]